MNTTPEQARERKLEAAKKGRALLAQLHSVADIEARATVLHDRVSESIKTICMENKGCFTKDQTEALTHIAVHLALVMDPSQSKPKNFWQQFRSELKSSTSFAKIALAGVIIAALVGIFTLGEMGVSFFNGERNADAVLKAEDRVKTENRVNATQSPNSNTSQAPASSPEHPSR